MLGYMIDKKAVADMMLEKVINRDMGFTVHPGSTYWFLGDVVEILKV